VTVQSDDDPANDHIRIFDPAHIERLRKEIERKDIGMIVLDPAPGVLDARINNIKQEEVRRGDRPSVKRGSLHQMKMRLGLSVKMFRSTVTRA
jgi:hypothetical protein